MTSLLTIPVLLVCAGFASCSIYADKSPSSEPRLASAIDVAKSLFKRPPFIEFPEQQPYSPHKIRLGKMLFFDARLSRIKNMSCASCHNPSFGWEMPIDHTVGAKGIKLSRSAPTLYGLHESPSLFRDGRSESLEQQAIMPLKNPLEMDSSIELIVERLKRIKTYRKLFATVFPDRELDESTIAESIAAFERTIQPGWAPFDRWVSGDDTAISEAAKDGFVLFTGKAMCSTCHSGWQFTDFEFHDIGLVTQDVGRYGIDSSKKQNKYAFKTPTLRNISSRAPYMHNGGIKSLEKVVEFYSDGVTQRDSLSSGFGAVKLNSGEVANIVAFMRTLDQEVHTFKIPNLPVD